MVRYQFWASQHRKRRSIVGKANGATIRDVRNDGDVTTKQEGTDKHYIAGNVGGIVGRAENTNITNADNSENHVAGAHNVGGVVGYLTGTSVVDSAQNDGGDIMRPARELATKRQANLSPKQSGNGLTSQKK